MKDRTELDQYIRGRIESGDYTQSAVPIVRGDDCWTLLADQHRQDKNYERDLQTICGPDPFAATVLNAARNLIARVQVPPAQAELALDRSSETPLEDQSPRLIAEKLKMRQETDLKVCEAINSGQIQSYEQLVRTCGSEEEVKASLRRIRRFKGAGVAVETVAGMVNFNPEELVRRTLRYERTESALVQLTSMEESKRGRVEVTVRIERPAGAGAWRRERVRLDTVNNLRTVKVLQAALLIETSVAVQLGAEQDLYSGKKFTSIVSLENEAELMEKFGPVAHIVESFS